MITLHNEWKNLSKKKNLQNEIQGKKRVTFLQNCEKTFWAVTAQWEEKAEKKTDPIVKNDYAFLQEIKKANHTTTVGGLNRRYQSKVANKRKHTDEENMCKEKEAQRTLAEHEECYDLNTSSNASETDSEADIIKDSKTKCKQPKLSVLNPSVCAVASSSFGGASLPRQMEGPRPRVYPFTTLATKLLGSDADCKGLQPASCFVIQNH